MSQSCHCLANAFDLKGSLTNDPAMEVVKQVEVEAMELFSSQLSVCSSVETRRTNPVKMNLKIPKISMQISPLTSPSCCFFRRSGAVGMHLTAEIFRKVGC